jgi:hypothetical protein
MRWITVSAALLILSASQAQAGLFDCCKKEPVCCCPAPTCCHVEPSCCAPAPTCCNVAPSCCAPAPACCHEAPSCHVPQTCCESAPVYYECCPPKKHKCCLCKLWDMEKRKNRWIMSKMGW